MTEPGTASGAARSAAGTASLPPDAAARDAAKRGDRDGAAPVLDAREVRFLTRGVSPWEQAAVVAVLAAVRSEEAQRVRRVARRDREPWARSQRVPQGFAELRHEA